MLGQMGNADETLVWIDMPGTVMLACTADGRKLPPFVNFKWKTMPKEAFPAGVIVRINEKGYMDEALMLEWIRVVWNRWPGALLHYQSMLILDAFRGHLTEAVKRALSESKTDLVVIPGGMTSTFLPLDVVLNKPFKDRVRLEYSEWMSGDNQKTPTGRLRRPPLLTVCEWVCQPGVLCQTPWLRKHLKSAASATALMEPRTTHCGRRPVTNCHLLTTVLLVRMNKTAALMMDESCCETKHSSTIFGFFFFFFTSSKGVDLYTGLYSKPFLPS